MYAYISSEKEAINSLYKQLNPRDSPECNYNPTGAINTTAVNNGES